MQAKNIDEVIQIMDGIVEDCIRRGDRLGYFAALYRTVTIIVRQRCNEGFFEDNERMRQLDTIFANRYFYAYFAHKDQSDTPSQCWDVSFDDAQKRRLMILQHLMLGMNAHINLDLGIATVEVSDGELTPSLERDFNRLNNILAGLIDTVQAQVTKVSPILRFGDWMAWRADEAMVSLGINLARDGAWAFAQELAALSKEERARFIAERDAAVAGASDILGSVIWYYVPIIWLIRRTESNNVRKVVENLSDESWMQTVHAQVDAIVAQAEAQGIDITKRTGAMQQVQLQDTE